MGKMFNLVNVILYTEGGFFGNYKWINLHLLISKFLCYALIGSIAVELQVQMVEFLNGDSTIMKVSALIGLFCSLLVNGFFTNKKWILKARKYYCALSLIATVGLVVTNMIVVYESNIIVRFVINTIINNSIMTVLSGSCSDTMNNMFQGSDKTVYQSKKQVISILASLVGMLLAFFIYLDLNGLIVFESIIYIVMMLDDLFIMKKIQKQVFEEAEDSPNTEIKEVA